MRGNLASELSNHGVTALTKHNIVSLLPLWLLLFLLLLPLYFVPWNSLWNAFFHPSAWVTVPFQAGVKGAVAEVKFNASLAKNYVFYLDLHWQSGNQSDHERVSLQVDSPSRYANGQPARRAPPLPVRLTVTRLSTDASIVLDQTFTQHQLDGWTEDYYMEVITIAHLEPGHYQARIEALDDMTALQDIPVYFDVHASGHPK